MKLELTEAYGTDTGFLRDLGKYDTLDEWVQDIREENTEFYVHYLSIEFYNEQFVVCDGQRSDSDEEAFEIAIDTLKNMPDSMIRLPNDLLNVEADVEEGELHIFWDDE